MVTPLFLISGAAGKMSFIANTHTALCFNKTRPYLHYEKANIYFYFIYTSVCHSHLNVSPLVILHTPELEVVTIFFLQRELSRLFIFMSARACCIIHGINCDTVSGLAAFNENACASAINCANCQPICRAACTPWKILCSLVQLRDIIAINMHVYCVNELQLSIWHFDGITAD